MTGTDDRTADGMPSVTPYAEMGEGERERLIDTLSNPAWWDDRNRGLREPADTIDFIAIVTCNDLLADAVPVVRRLEGRPEPVPLDRVRDALFELYEVDEDTQEECRRLAEERRDAGGERTSRGDAREGSDGQDG